MKTLNQMHPSNILYRGEARDFAHAMRLVEQECSYEKAVLPEHDDAHETLKKTISSLDEFASRAAACRTEYNMAVSKAANELFQKWADSSDEYLQMIGACGLNGSYEDLAI